MERTLKAVNRFYENCKNKVKGKKGYPKFKKNTRSVEYKVSGWKLSENRKYITFIDKKGIGRLKLIGSRDLHFYQIEQIKRVRIVRRADGYYVQFAIQADPTHKAKSLTPSQKAIGIDLGSKYFLADSQGNIEANPQFYRKGETCLSRLNRRKSKKFKKGKPISKNYQKARNRYARKHLKGRGEAFALKDYATNRKVIYANASPVQQREEFVKRVALRLIQSNDLVAYEDLNVKGLVRNRHLAKSISDAGWYLFRRWLEYFGCKYGKVTVAVPPYNTSQNCSNCGQKVQKSLSTRTHICSHCGFIEDRDINAAINILKLALSVVGHTGSKAWGDLPSSDSWSNPGRLW
ncbi:MAG: transposase [Phormidium sp.]